MKRKFSFYQIEVEGFDWGVYIVLNQTFSYILKEGVHSHTEIIDTPIIQTALFWIIPPNNIFLVFQKFVVSIISYM